MSERSGLPGVSGQRWGGAWIGRDIVDQCPINNYGGMHQARIIDCINCDHHIVHFVPGDEELHVELVGRKDTGFLYCGCMLELARESLRRQYSRLRFGPHGCNQGSVLPRFSSILSKNPSVVSQL